MQESYRYSRRETQCGEKQAVHSAWCLPSLTFSCCWCLCSCYSTMTHDPSLNTLWPLLQCTHYRCWWSKSRRRSTECEGPSSHYVWCKQLVAHAVVHIVNLHTWQTRSATIFRFCSPYSMPNGIRRAILIRRTNAASSSWHPKINCIKETGKVH